MTDNTKQNPGANTTTQGLLYDSDPNKGWRSGLTRQSTGGQLVTDNVNIWFEDNQGGKVFNAPLSGVVAEESGKTGLFTATTKVLHLTIGDKQYWIDFGPSVFAGPTIRAFSSKGTNANQQWLKIISVQVSK